MHIMMNNEKKYVYTYICVKTVTTLESLRHENWF